MAEPRGNHDRGAVAIVVALFTLVAMVLMAFVVDRGFAYVQRTQVQNTADAAALAAAQLLCATPAAGTVAIKDVAIQYGTLNGATIASGDIEIFDDGYSPESGVSVAVNDVVTNVFGAFVGNGSTAVAARATARRQCTSSYQFVAEIFTNFNGQGTVGGNIYGGECFDGGGGSFATVAVWRPITYNCPPPHNGSTPIDPGSNGSIANPLYSQPVVATSAAFANAGYNKTFLDGLPYAKSCKVAGSADFVASGSPPAPFVCSGTGSSEKLDVAGTVNRGIVAEGDIALGSTSYTGTTSWLIYSKFGDITITGSVSDKAVIYAPSGSVTVNGGSTQVNGLVIARNITFNGGNQEAGNQTTIRVPGPWRLTQ
jgi:Flp pilus assembly protein TadG